MIPKVIHYCWFGGNPKPAKVQKCIKSWKDQCPDWEIREWNESNYNCSQHPYTNWCMANRKWAFLSDYARLEIVYTYGGVYLDTDVELVRSLNPLLTNSAFFCFETSEYVNTGLGFGAEQNAEVVKAIMREYNRFTNEDSIKPVGCPKLNTEALCKLGLIQDGELQKVGDALILPVEYFNPYNDPTGKLNITSNTFGIHWYFKSALPIRARWRGRITQPFHRVFGSGCFKWLKVRN